MNPIKVSIIMPVYNTAPYLKECLDSICRQTLAQIEVICVNDGSTDESLSILEQYAQKDDRVFVCTQENRGQSSARNKGAELAHGDYLYFMDSDDVLELSALETLYERAEADNLDAYGYFVCHLEMSRFYKEQKSEKTWDDTVFFPVRQMLRNARNQYQKLLPEEKQEFLKLLCDQRQLFELYITDVCNEKDKVKTCRVKLSIMKRKLKIPKAD